MADALAAPSATTATVLAAAGARDVDFHADRVYFRPPDPRLTGGVLHFDGAHAEPREPPQRVQFEGGVAGTPIGVGELATVFGPAASGPQTTSLAPVWFLVFPTACRPPEFERLGMSVVRVSAEIATDNLAGVDLVRGLIPSWAHVARVVLQRERTARD